MALFKFKKETQDVSKKEDRTPKKITGEAKKPAVKKETKKAEAIVSRSDITSALIRPRITEKATDQAERGVYVFEVSPRATKENIAQAIKYFYKVTPRKINIVKTPRKKVSSKVRGKYGMKPAIKKAYVYMKKGDRIEIV